MDILGFENAEWAGEAFTCVSRDQAGIYLCEGGQGQGRAWAWIGVSDVRPLYNEWKHKGGDDPAAAH